MVPSRCSVSNNPITTLFPRRNTLFPWRNNPFPWWNKTLFLGRKASYITPLAQLAVKIRKSFDRLQGLASGQAGISHITLAHVDGLHEHARRRHEVLRRHQLVDLARRLAHLVADVSQ